LGLLFPDPPSLSRRELFAPAFSQSILVSSRSGSPAPRVRSTPTVYDGTLSCAAGGSYNAHHSVGTVDDGAAEYHLGRSMHGAATAERRREYLGSCASFRRRRFVVCRCRRKSASLEEVSLADCNAPELHTAQGSRANTMLERVATGKPAQCEARRGRNGRVRSYERVIALCRIGGRSIGGLLRAKAAPEGQ
jgi:hypothetical protein